MTQDAVSGVLIDALVVTFKISMPFLGAGLVVGLLISIFQAVTQIQEMTLSFIPKIIVTAVVLVVAGPWMLDQMLSYTRDIFTSIPTVVGM